MYPKINLFGMSFDSAMLFMILGIFAMIVVNLFRANKFGISKLKSVAISITNNVGAFAGAKILFLLENLDSLQSNISFGGFSFYGTVFMLPVFMLITYSFYGMDKKQFLNFSTPSVLMELAFYRTGCLLAGCCCGIPAEWGFAMAHSPEILRVPVQLIEIILDLGIFATLLYVERKAFFKENGLLYPLFMICYGVIRFVVEFFRVRDVLLWGMSESHFLSLLAIAIGVVWIVLAVKKHNKKASA